MKLGDAIRITRQKAFYTQKEFSEELNVAVSTINRWELNKAKPNVKAMKSIKTFCEENELDYKIIENAWLGYSKEVIND
ncbi:helix-turn-helix transcriptional regulator [Peptacetobacter hiranonis]|uniref:helix-turn-helix domain-containing protein n=1 Tax=Peptacetobacter hiranonis TaxID=89152 RepID=UPI00191724D7|nr:helix-turn-helix transcriptional regulator [Peptacetobacter hiranonis]QQQ86330.1 helix-turn-helix transcriptional regulator [Peptacetobacter hiranonis]